MHEILILHGPNLNLLGIREPDTYGRVTMEEIDHRMRLLAADLGIQIREVLAIILNRRGK